MGARAWALTATSRRRPGRTDSLDPLHRSVARGACAHRSVHRSSVQVFWAAPERSPERAQVASEPLRGVFDSAEGEGCFRLGGCANLHLYLSPGMCAARVRAIRESSDFARAFDQRLRASMLQRSSPSV